MDNPPLITIGITAYNAADTIARAVDSALDQDWDNTEIIVIDDASTDQTLSILEPYKGRISIIKHPKNKGVAAARNTLLQHAQGEFIAFFDDDDQSLPERLTTQYQRITDYEQQMNTQTVACYVSGTRLYTNGYGLDLEAIGSRGIPPYGPAIADRILFFAAPAPEHKNWFFGHGTPTCSLMIRTNIMQDLGGFDPNFRRVEDLDFAVRLSLRDGHFIGCPEKLFIQYATLGSDKTADKNLTAELQLVEKHKVYLKTRGRYTYAKTWPKIRHAHFTKRYDAMARYLLRLWVQHPIKTLQHILTTGPARLKHEAKMKAKL